MTACIVGWAHSKFGKHDGVDVETLIARAATEAMAGKSDGLGRDGSKPTGARLRPVSMM